LLFRQPQHSIKKRTMYRNFLVTIACFVSLSFTYNISLRKDNPHTPAEKVNLQPFNNLYKINDSIYRSEQPTKKGMQALQQLGIKTVLNFRNHHNDVGETKHTRLVIERLPQNTNKISQEFIISALKIIQQSKKPILIHCLHGSDRTGVVIAAYRMVYENWTKEEAIAELREKQFGYHETWFPHIVTVLTDLNVAYIRSEVLNSKK
jgi:tyrosine-protein phosphatase SIW14